MNRSTVSLVSNQRLFEGLVRGFPLSTEMGINWCLINIDRSNASGDTRGDDNRLRCVLVAQGERAAAELSLSGNISKVRQNPLSIMSDVRSECVNQFKIKFPA